MKRQGAMWFVVPFDDYSDLDWWGCQGTHDRYVDYEAMEVWFKMDSKHLTLCGDLR